jgi:hypothetical protein
MTLELAVDSHVAPATFVAALTDFTERRPALWPNLDPRYYRVHACGDTWAEVTEGSSFAGGVWERARYDWSRPGMVSIQVLDSNAFAPGSFWRYQVEPNGQGGSRITFTLSRVGRTLKGKLLASLLRVFGPRVFRRDLEVALQKIAAATEHERKQQRCA